MSSNCPPQLQLSIQPSTTTFKRSFDQFGFDLESPVGSTDAGGSGADNGNDRNKRARSSSSFSESSDSTEASRDTSSTLASTSESVSSISRNEPSAVAAVLATARPAIDPPPRLPTPVIQDIDMAEVLPENDTETAGLQQQTQTPQHSEDRYRLSLERFNAFENNISLLRRSQPLSPDITRSPSPPPMLPPLSIVSSSNQHLHQHQPRTAHLSPTDIAWSSSPFLDNFLTAAEGGEESEAPTRHFRQLPASHERPQRDTADEEIEMVNGFRDRLNTALERLRPASPLVPGLESAGDVGLGAEEETTGQGQEDEDSQEDEEEEEEEGEEDNDNTDTNDRPHSLLPDPPTLPPIPPLNEDNDSDWNELQRNTDLRQRFIRAIRERTQALEDQLRQSSSSSTSSFWPSSNNPSLRDHPLPSPILRDLHSWMQERGSLEETSPGDVTGTPISGPPTDSHADQRQQNPPSSTQSVSTGPQQLSPISGGVSRVNEWDIYDRFPPQSTTAPAFSGLAPASSSAAEVAQESPGDTSFLSAASSGSSDLFSNSTSLSYTRNLADEAAVRSLDHGIGLGLGFGPGAARPMPPLISSGQSPTPRQNDATDEQRRHTGTSTLTSTPNGLTSTSDVGQSQSHRPIMRFPSNNWLSFSRGGGIGQLPDLDLDFASMAGTAGSAVSSPSTSDDWRSEPFPAAPPPGDRPLVRDSSPTTTTTTSSIDEASFLNPTMSTLDFFSSPTAPVHLPASMSHLWDEQPPTHQRSAVFRPPIRRCPHNPQCVPPNQNNQAPASASSSSNPHIVPIPNDEIMHLEYRRGFGTNSFARPRDVQDAQYRFLMDGDFGSESDPLPLPNRISSTSTPLLNRLGGSDNDRSNFMSNRLVSSDVVQGQHIPFHRQRLRSSHSRARLGSSTSLVSENASEMRRMEDRAEVTRSRTIHALSSLATQGSEDRTNVDDTSTYASNDERDRDLRRALAWDEIRARQRQQQLRHIGSAQTSDPGANMTNTRSSFDRLVQNAWQSLEQRDASVSPEDEFPTWRARNVSTHASSAATVGGASEDVDMAFVERQQDNEDSTYWSAIFRELGFGADASMFDNRSTRTLGSRRDGWESDHNPHSLSWSDTIPGLANESRASGASTSTNSTAEGPQHTQRFPPFSSLVERSPSFHSTNESMDTTVDRPTLRRFPLEFSRVPSLPSPDLGGSFNAERPAQPTSPTSAIRPEESSRRFPGLSTRQPSFSTLGSYAMNHYHYQIPTTSSSTNNHPTRFDVRPRQQPRSATPDFGSRHRPWETSFMDTSDDGPETDLIATLVENQERIAHLTARTEAFADTIRSTNLAEFAPGPFRNTLQHRIDQHNAHRRRAGLPLNPPSIPPLSFGDSNLTSLSNSVPGSEPRTPEEVDQHPINTPFQTSRQIPPRPWEEGIRPNRPGAPSSLNSFPPSRLQPRSFASARAAAMTEATRAMTEANRARGQADMYLSSINRHPRPEPFRSNDSAPQRTSAATNSNLSLEEIDNMARQQRQVLELSLRNRNRSRYNLGADNPVPPNRPVYPGLMDDDDSLRERLSNLAAGRGRRNRLHSPHEMMFFTRGGRRGRPLGDFMRDEDFDESYESLLSLAQTLGDVKPRSTPTEIIEKMEKAQYKDWATADSDQRCPICLDDYGQTDTVLKLTNCSHWLHQDCLHQWLQTANTCPVCRKSVSTNTGFRRGHHHHHRPFGAFRRDPPPGPGPSQGGSGSNAGNNTSSLNQGHHHGFPPAPWRRGPPPA